MIQRITTLTVLVAFLCGPASAQQGKTMLPDATQSGEAASSTERKINFSDYEPWCGKPLPLAPCSDEIIRVDKTILEREKESQRTGRGYNAGTSLRGCQIYCILRHFPHDTPDECKRSIVTFEKVAARKPYLWRTDLRQLLLRKCEIAF